MGTKIPPLCVRLWGRDKLHGSKEVNRCAELQSKVSRCMICFGKSLNPEWWHTSPHFTMGLSAGGGGDGMMICIPVESTLDYILRLASTDTALTHS